MKHLQSFRYVDAVARTGSIRGAAETLAITPSALNRRVLALEDELGVPIFERLSHGVRLSTAGEILIEHIRGQISDMDRVRSQIADLSGVRRGRVAIACSQALLPHFLPKQISQYRHVHPGVTFGVYQRDRAAAEQALTDHSADLALVFEPVRLADFQVLCTVRQPLFAVMSAKHPLAGEATLRLRDCLQYPLALPSSRYGVRHLLEAGLANSSLHLEPMIESDSFEFLGHAAMSESLITFQIPIGLPEDAIGPQRSNQQIVARQLDERDAPVGSLYCGQLRSRTLPVASAQFANQLLSTLQGKYS